MNEDMLEKTDEQVAESIRKLTRATSAMADAINEGVTVVKHAVKRSGDVAEELMVDTRERVKRHPAESMTAIFTLGALVGGLVGWLMSKRR
jgi:hypothetical protein